MADELSARVRALQAERYRPAPERPAAPDSLRELINALHELFTTPTDCEREEEHDT